MKLFVDDIRDAYDDSWTVVRKVEEAINFISKYYPQITHISLDHDIENRPSDETFKPVAHYIGAILMLTFDEQIIRVHSDNPVGGKELVEIMADYGVESYYDPFTSEADFKKKFGLK